MIIDAHQHFWMLARGDYDFPRPDDPVLYRDFMPADLRPELAAAGVAQTILVQATDTIEESRFLLEIASRTGFVAGVVGWWDARRPETLDALRRLPHAARLVGARPMLQKFDDVSWLLEATSVSAIGRLGDAGLVFDALVDTRHLETIHALACAVPGLRMVIDHMGKPWRHPDRLGAWMTAIRKLAALDNCWIKISGYPFAAERLAAACRFDVVAALLKEWFPPDRLVWGSDWPVARRECGYQAALAAARHHFSDCGTESVFAGNARRLYGIGSMPGGEG